MLKRKIVYICHYSTSDIREQLHLRAFSIENFFRKICRVPPHHYVDFGTWNADFIDAINSEDNFECFVVVQHKGLHEKLTQFSMNGVNFSVLRESCSLFMRVLWRIVPRFKVSYFLKQSIRIKSIVNKINPDVILICGAENPEYSTCALLFENKPIFVILQTLLNSPKRISLGIGSEYRRRLENMIFKRVMYYGSINIEECNYIKTLNPDANCLKLMFPSSGLTPNLERRKEFDFVFFANGLSKYKGTEDALRGFITVHKKYRAARINIIGSCESAYRRLLDEIVNSNGIQDNVVFSERYPRKKDVIQQVQRAKVAVLPGITAPLNSTVRECMFLGIPVIVYETGVTQIINKEAVALLEAKMENVVDLGGKMLYAYEHSNEMNEMAKRAKLYAENNFSKNAVKQALTADINAIINHYYFGEMIPEGLMILNR